VFSRILSYINFLFKSKNQHGVHSPFVFDLLTKCLYQKTHLPGFDVLKNYQQKLLQNKQTINVTDFGAGSKVFNSNQRKVANIAKHAGISKKRGRLLLRLVDYFEFETVLELGTSLGISTAAMALGNAKSNITTLEGCTETAQMAQNGFDHFDLQNISVKVGNFKETLPKSLKNKTFDFIYFDGNHSKEATLHYFETCLPHTHNDSLLLFDDIHWSKDMETAWESIKNHPEVQVTIDTYQWGFVFLRKEQQKEHFTIRV
jgi:predicted O-methyltransferase YrrM